MTKLKPCPFCGGEAEFCKTTVPNTITIGTFVQCINCGVRTRYVIDLGDEYTIINWNRRTNNEPTD